MHVAFQRGRSAGGSVADAMGQEQARNKAMKDVFTRCFKKTVVQVCTIIIMHLLSRNVMYSCIVLLFPAFRESDL